MNEKLLIVKDLLNKHKQQHLLQAYDRLSTEEQNKLLDEILTLNFNQVTDLYESTKEKPNFQNESIEPIPHITKSDLSDDEIKKYTKIGEEIIRSGKLAVVTMAGGQGTRLGHTGPKGTYDLGLPSHKSIFEILCDNLLEAKQKYGVDIPWYIMTSDENNEDTVNFFEKHNYFGHPKSVISFFKQGKLPMISTEGKILLDENGMIKQAADGHGGVFEAITKNGIIFDMKQKGIEWIFICGVDNVLAKFVDPIFLGLQVDSKKLTASKSVVKAYAKEKVGVFCNRNGKPGIIEYSEISEELANATDETGGFLLGDSNIVNHQFHISILDKISTEKLPYHVAFKKASYLDENGNIVKPREPNAYKFEAFLFDIFSYVPDMLVFRVKREEEFAPVKNAEGNDSPETARNLYKAFHKIEE